MKEYSLVISSCFFMIPGLFGIFNNICLLGWLSVLTSIASINYWRNPMNNWRRWTDLIVAKLSFIVYFINGITNIRNFHILVIGWLNTMLLMYCYYNANSKWIVQNKSWIYYHMAFHLFVASGQLIVIYGIMLH